MNNPMTQTPPPMNDQNSPDSRAEKINTIWKIVAAIYTLSALGVVFYWEFTDGGLNMMICEWQAELLSSDSCYIALNIVGSLFAFLIPLFIVKFIVEKVTGVKIANPNYR